MKEAVYVLRCPDTNNVRYVGRTTSIYARASAARSATSYSPRVRKWLKELKSQGKTVIFEVMSDGHEWHVARYEEERLVKLYFAQHGNNLLNTQLIPKYSIATPSDDWNLSAISSTG